MNNAELWGGLFWLGLSIFVVAAGRNLGLGGVTNPGGGALLFWAGLLMCAFSGSIVLGALRYGGPRLGSLWAGVHWGNALIVIVAIALYAVFLERLGFLLATVPLLLVLLRGVDPVRWRVAVPLALFATLGVWWVLKRALLIQLPSGLFEIG